MITQLFFLQDYLYFKERYKLAAIDLSKQQAFDVNANSIQQMNYTGNLEHAGNTTVFFIFEVVNQTILDFSKGTRRLL